MELKVNIKLGEVNNLTDARYAAGVGATFVGFNFSPQHPQYIEPPKAGEIAGWLDGPSLVGEWDGGIADIIYDTAERLKLDHIQLNNYEPELAHALRELNVIQNIALNENTPTRKVIEMISGIHEHCMYFMLSFDTAETQEKYLAAPAHRQMLTEMCRDYPVIFNFFFSRENLLPLIEEHNPFGINLKGSSEVKPGYKDFDEMNDLVDLLEN